MGLILVPSEIIGKSTSVKTALSNIVSGYQNVLTQVSNFANDEALQSDSWTKLKEKVLEYHTYIEQGMLVVQESVETDLATLEGSIGSETLDEDELINIIDGLENEKKNCEEAIEQWNIQKNSMAIYVVNSSLCSMIERSIEILEKEIENLNELINTYKEKLEFLYTAEDSTKSLLDSAIQLLTAMSALISEVGVKIMSANPEATLQGIDCEIYKNIISKELEIYVGQEEIAGISKKGYEFLVDLELGVDWKNADYIKLDAQGNIVSIRNQDVGDGGITVGVGIYVKESDMERIEMLDKLGITWNDTEQWVSYDVATQAYNNISGRYIDLVDGILKKYNVTVTQEQYDALFVMAYNREALFCEGGAVAKMLSSGNNNISDWRSALLEEYQALGGWKDYADGWTNRIDDELELYFKGDYIRNHG